MLFLKVVGELFAFTSTGDAPNSLVFGLDIDTWLNYTLIFFGISSFAFVWVWATGFIRDRQAGKPIDKPWE